MITWTGIELIRQARNANGTLGEGVIISANELSDDLMTLNLLLASWDSTLYAHTQETFTLTANQYEYTWGLTTGDLATDRPIDMLDMTFLRDGVDYPIELIREAKYKGLFTKALTVGRPTKVFFDPQFPLAKLWFYPIPGSAYTVYLTSLKALTEITDATAQLQIPMELAAALKWNLALDLCPNYNVPVNPVLQVRAAETRKVVQDRAFNYQIFPVRMDNVENNNRRRKGGTILSY